MSGSATFVEDYATGSATFVEDYATGSATFVQDKLMNQFTEHETEHMQEQADTERDGDGQRLLHSVLQVDAIRSLRSAVCPLTHGHAIQLSFRCLFFSLPCMLHPPCFFVFCRISCLEPTGVAVHHQ